MSNIVGGLVHHKPARPQSDPLCSYAIAGQDWDEMPETRGKSPEDIKRGIYNAYVSQRLARNTLSRQGWFKGLSSDEKAKTVREFASQVRRIPPAVSRWMDEASKMSGKEAWPKLSRRLYKTTRWFKGKVQTPEKASSAQGDIALAQTGHILGRPDGTGPYGRGAGPGQGRADGSGLAMIKDPGRLMNQPYLAAAGGYDDDDDYDDWGYQASGQPINYAWSDILHPLRKTRGAGGRYQRVGWLRRAWNSPTLKKMGAWAKQDLGLTPKPPVTPKMTPQEALQQVGLAIKDHKTTVTNLMSSAGENAAAHAMAERAAKLSEKATEQMVDKTLVAGGLKRRGMGLATKLNLGATGGTVLGMGVLARGNQTREDEDEATFGLDEEAVHYMPQWLGPVAATGATVLGIPLVSAGIQEIQERRRRAAAKRLGIDPSIQLQLGITPDEDELTKETQFAKPDDDDPTKHYGFGMAAALALPFLGIGAAKLARLPFNATTDMLRAEVEADQMADQEAAAAKAKRRARKATARTRLALAEVTNTPVAPTLAEEAAQVGSEAARARIASGINKSNAAINRAFAFSDDPEVRALYERDREKSSGWERPGWKLAAAAIPAAAAIGVGTYFAGQHTGRNKEADAAENVLTKLGVSKPVKHPGTGEVGLVITLPSGQRYFRTQDAMTEYDASTPGDQPVHYVLPALAAGLLAVPLWGNVKRLARHAIIGGAGAAAGRYAGYKFARKDSPAGRASAMRTGALLGGIGGTLASMAFESPLKHEVYTMPAEDRKDYAFWIPAMALTAGLFGGKALGLGASTPSTSLLGTVGGGVGGAMLGNVLAKQLFEKQGRKRDVAQAVGTLGGALGGGLMGSRLAFELQHAPADKDDDIVKHYRYYNTHQAVPEPSQPGLIKKAIVRGTVGGALGAGVGSVTAMVKGQPLVWQNIKHATGVGAGIGGASAAFDDAVPSLHYERQFVQ
jgi:hypothetical protein